MLTFYFTLSIALMILVPLVLAGLLRRRTQAPWILFAIGTLTFIGSQVVHLPLNSLLTKLHVLPKTGLTDPAISLLQTVLVLGFTAGLCEETARAVGYYFLKRFRRIEDGIMLGLGHGGVESMIFGGVLTASVVSSLISMVGTDLSTLKLPAEQLAALQTQMAAISTNPLAAAGAPLLERLLAITIHVSLSIIVLQAFRKKNPLYYVIAVVYHMLIDAVMVYVAMKITNPALYYPILIGLLLPGLIYMILLWRKKARPAAVYTQSPKAELGIFFAALRKELIQQWRTRRFLVVMAVFVLFGLTSPLLAKFTPEILKAVPGAEQFSYLVPTPTVADAMAQYIKNITQFGFILAVLLGMNAVAGEKESGTAAMILSKPMPRWAFILSKFGAQALVYVSAYLVAGLGAYYYSLILFGQLNALTFTGINLLLLLWLLTYVAAALLGSVIGPTIASAAGVGIGLAVALLIAGSIPVYGQLTPGGLTAWASVIGAGKTIPPNGGAIAASFVLIVLFLVYSVALFERQEI
jgi:ABC-2 type transport system permease protein